MSLFPPKEPMQQRSANLYVRQWKRLEEIAEAEGGSVTLAMVMRAIVDLGLKEYERQSRGGRK